VGACLSAKRHALREVWLRPTTGYSQWARRSASTQP